MLFTCLELSTSSSTIQISPLFWVLVRLPYHREAFLSIPGHVVTYLSVLLKLLLFVAFIFGIITNSHAGVLCCLMPPSDPDLTLSELHLLLLSVLYSLASLNRCGLQVCAFCSFMCYLFTQHTFI